MFPRQLCLYILHPYFSSVCTTVNMMFTRFHIQNTKELHLFAKLALRGKPVFYITLCSGLFSTTTNSFSCITAAV